MIFRPNQKPGFTLLEILVSTGIFMVVMVVAVGIFTLSVSSSSTSEQMRLNAQAARFAFEAMTRETRLARGLVYTNPDINQPLMLIPPIEATSQSAPTCSDSGGADAEISVYRAIPTDRQSDGQNLYTLTRRVYFRGVDAKLKLRIDQAYGGVPTSVSRIYADVTSPTGIAWDKTATPENIMPGNMSVDQFRLVCTNLYPAPGQPIDSIKAQPFIQLDLTVLNKKYNENKEEERQVKTTLRTMIVPRSFAGPLEVVQPGVQGSGQ